MPSGEVSRGCPGLHDGRVDSEGEKDRAKEIPLLHSPGAGGDLRGHAAGAREEGALNGGNNSRPTERVTGSGREWHARQQTCG